MIVAGAVIIAPLVLNFLTLGLFGTLGLGLLRLVIATAAVLAALILIYRHAINPDVWISRGALGATGLWLPGTVDQLTPDGVIAVPEPQRSMM